MSRINLILIGLVFLIISPGSYAAEPDSLVYFQDLTFQNDIEKAAFEGLARGEEPDYTALFLSICDSCLPADFKLFKDRMAQQITLWQSSSKFNKLNQKKKVKKIYEDVHKTFLEKFEINHELADIFRSGKYNCVSASALYGLFFNALDIPVSV